MSEDTIINSRLFKKVEEGESFFSISDLIKQIWDDIQEDRKRIEELLGKALYDSTELKEAIQEFNEINQLPNITVFGDIPNKYLNNFNDNVQLQINLLNAVQRLQANWVKKQETKGNKKDDKKDDDDWNLSDVIDKKGIGSEYKDGIKRDE